MENLVPKIDFYKMVGYSDKEINRYVMFQLFSKEAEWTLVRVILYMSIIIGVYKIICTFNSGIFYLSKNYFWDKNIATNLQDYVESGTDKKPLAVVLDDIDGSQMGEISCEVLKGKFSIVKIKIRKNLMGAEKKVEVKKKDAGRDFDEIIVNLKS